MAAMTSDVKVAGVELFYLPVKTRMPLKFGPETLTEVTCARVRITVERADGARASGWGETPLSVQWVWPGRLSYEERHAALRAFTGKLAAAWAAFDVRGPAMRVGYEFVESELPRLLAEFNRTREGSEPMPRLAGLVCCSPFDLALHDAFGKCSRKPAYLCYGRSFLYTCLAGYFGPKVHGEADFAGLYPEDFLVRPRPDRLPAWHLVAGKDPIDQSDLKGDEPDDGYPVLLRDWIRRDGLKCLKIKLRGDDADWDY